MYKVTEIEFFNILMDKLNTLPESQLYKIINYYKNYLSDDSISRKSFEDILKDIEDPNFLKKILINKDKNLNIKFNSETLTQSDLKHTSNSTNINYKKHITSINYNKSLNINILLKIGIIVLSLITLIPILTTTIAVILGIFELNIIITTVNLKLALGYSLDSQILDLIPEFIFNFPKPSLFLFSIGTSLLSLLLLLSVWYIVKVVYFMIKNISSKLNTHTDKEEL